ncbi:Bifunctional inhibitor/plant lipid transfer protein/seed storage helical domain superfamily [Arabidopsis suecica]|uniref:Bifunctional inhibitor/plant lipid transfer protein/seed storage helical domain superfamily n=1 Tax=Arabidopsis suecica TaxID=45249 RepID=A0A8T2F7D1_ARASU|nr:Bifunctional inhibitor/plant lipid transfer protein/seed storage helical domain superfamily [Arabidopsis suecica]
MKMGMVFVFVLLTVFMAVMSSTRVSAQSNCKNELKKSLKPCFSYLTSSYPSLPDDSDCCPSLLDISKTSVDCFCQYLNSGGSILDINANFIQARRLPEICGVDPNLASVCNEGKNFLTSIYEETPIL